MMSFQWLSRISAVVATTVLLSACGGGGSSSGARTPPPMTSIGANVALASAGAVVTSSFVGNESFAIDGDTTTTNFWAAGAVGDTLTIEFAEVFALESIQISAGSLSSNGEFSLETSTDGVTFTEFDNISTCSTFRLGASGYECEFIQTIDAQFLRLTLLDDVANIEIYEIEVTGV